MPRTEGLYTTATVTELPDGGDFKIEVLNTSQAVVASVPLSVQNGNATVDVTAATASLWPDDAQFRLVATTLAGRTSSRFLDNGLGGIDFRRIGTTIPANDPVHTLVGFDIVAAYRAYTPPVVNHTPTLSFTSVSALVAQLATQYDHGGAIYALTGSHTITTQIEPNVKNCIITTDPGNPATIDGGGDRTGVSGSNFGFLLDNCENTEVSNFNIRGMRYHGVMVGREDNEPGGLNNRILNNHLSNCGTTGVAIRNGAVGTLVQGGSISSIGSGDTRGEGVYGGLGNDINDGNLTNHVTDTTVRGVHFYDLNAEAIDFKRNCRGILIEYCWSDKVSVKSQGAFTVLIDISDAEQADYDADCIIRHNYVEGTSTREYDGDGIVCGLGHAEIHSNIVANNAGAGVIIYADFDGPVKTVNVHSNIVWNNSGGDIVTNTKTGNGTSSFPATVTRTKNYVSANAVGDETTTPQFVGPFPATSINAFSPSDSSVNDASSTATIQSAGSTFGNTSPQITIDGPPTDIGTRYDVRFNTVSANLDPNDARWEDPLTSVVPGSFPHTFYPLPGMPSDGSPVYVGLYAMPSDGNSFALIDVAAFTSVTLSSGSGLTVSSFTHESSINSGIQNLFGYANTVGVAAYMSPLQAVRPAATKTLVTQSDFDNLQPGEHGVIPDGTNLGGIYLTTPSGSDTQKKWISGGSNASGVGANTVVGSSFFIFDGGQHFCISNVKFNVPGQFLFYIASGKHNWVFDNHVIGCQRFMTAEAPGSYGNPGIDDNHFVGNYASGDGDAASAMFAPKGSYTNINGPINRATIMAFNTGENFEYILRDQPSWWWTEPYSGESGGNSGFQQPEMTHSQFIGNRGIGGGNGETITVKTSGWNIQYNLLENANGHFSLRSTMNTVFANNVYIGPRRGFNMTGANDCEIYNNIAINQGFDNETMAFGRASIDNGTPGFPAYAQCRNNKMKYNWFLPDVGATHYVTALVFFNVIDGYPASNNEFDSNFYRTNGLTDTEWEHDPSQVASRPIMSAVMDQARFDSNNPGSSKNDQYTASMAGVLSQTRTVPGTITTGILDINGNPYTVDLPSWIGPGGAIVNTTA